MSIGAVTTVALLASVLLDMSDFNAGGVLSWVPECGAKKAGGSCALCGLTHSFIAISHGDLESAFAAHPSGIWIYLAFVITAVGGIAAAISHLRQWNLTGRP